MFEIFSGKKIIVTGNTGFKGTWLSLWLLKNGAQVCGVSLNESAKNNLPDVKQFLGDICDKAFLQETILSVNPDFIFHLAAQPLVPYGVINPYETFNTNVIGTLNLLEIIREYNSPCVAIFVTSDKCYAPLDTSTGYVETDKLGGNDPYSASKAASEILIQSYAKTYFQNSNRKIVSARAGNVIGGGDFSPSRLIPDCVTSWHEKKAVKIRNANAVRPWQHVLEAVHGYLVLAEFVSQHPEYSGHSFNFGPHQESNLKVIDVIKMLYRFFDGSEIDIPLVEEIPLFEETKILRLNINKAIKFLKWKPILTIEDTMKLTGQWYKQYFANQDNELVLTKQQLDFFVEKIEKGV